MQSSVLKSAGYKCFHVGSTDIIIMIKWLYTEIRNYLADQQKSSIKCKLFCLSFNPSYISVSSCSNIVAVTCSLTLFYRPEMLARPTYFSECVSRTNSDFVFIMVMDKKVTGRVCSLHALEGHSFGWRNFPQVFEVFGFSSGVHPLLLHKKWALERGFPSLIVVSLLHGISYVLEGKSGCWHWKSYCIRYIDRVYFQFFLLGK